MFYLQIEGRRIEALSQNTDGVSEPIDTSVTKWDDFSDAMSWALHESYERGGLPVDVMSEDGKAVARVTDQESRGIELELADAR